jgi:hypothetical protein
VRRLPLPTLAALAVVVAVAVTVGTALFVVPLTQVFPLSAAVVGVTYHALRERAPVSSR